MTLLDPVDDLTITIADHAVDEGHLNLFATATYNRRNLGPDDSYLRIDHHHEGRLVGTFAGVATGDTFWSGFSAPFCGPDLLRDRETPRLVQALVDHTLDELRSRGVERIKVKARPGSYSASETYVVHALMHRGIGITSSELSYGIDVSPFADGAAYRSSLKAPARRALRHADSEPFEYRLAEDDHEFAIGYELIAANRARRGYPLRLSLEYLLSLQADFGDRIRFFVLHHSGTPVAAALLYRLRPDIELVEYWGDDHDLDRSPMNRLAEEVCTRAIDEGVRLVDLGISSVDGEPNDGLIQFKQSIGATAELRLDLEGSLR